MTLKKCWATPSVVLFYQSLWVWEKGLFLSKKSHILSHFFLFLKIKTNIPYLNKKNITEFICDKNN